MKKLFTTMLLGMFALGAMAQLSIWYNGSVVYQREYSLIDSITFGMPATPDPELPTDENALTPEQTKDYLMAVAKRMVNTFNTADQKAAIDLADGLYVKYKEYEWDEFDERYDERFEDMFGAPRRYLKGVVRGETDPASMDKIWVFGFAEESAVFEADEQNHKWVYKGAASDNSLIMRCKDNNGVQCEAKIWGEGTTKTYEYTWDAYHWETPKVYAPAGTAFTYYYGHGYYDGEWRSFSKDDSGRWYYYDWENEGALVFVYESDIETIYAETQNGPTYTYEKSTGKYFYYDYENEYKVYDGKRTVRAIVPAKIYFTLKQGSTEISRLEVSQEMVKNNHAYFSLKAKLANLTWTTDVKVNSTNGSGAFAFFYGQKQFLSAKFDVPVYELIPKTDDQTYEDWVKLYGDRYDELLKKIGEANGEVDMFGEVQIKAKVNNFGYAYRDWMKWEDDYDGHFRTKASVKAFCSIFNDNSTNGIYFNSSVKQAEVRVDPAYDEADEEYYPEGVLYFPKDGTKYAFEPYFDRKPFTDLRYMVEDIVNAYIKMSQNLYNEVGDVSFDGKSKNDPEPIDPPSPPTM